MSASEIERTLVRLVHEIIEKNDGARELGLIGIRRIRLVPILGPRNFTRGAHRTVLDSPLLSHGLRATH